MIDLFTIIIPLLLLTFIIHKILKLNDNKYKKIDTLIEIKTKQLNDLNKQIDEIAYDNSTTLTKSQINALKVYEQSNIQIPVDIIEELAHMRLSDTEEIISFVENQRNYWKLENTKKPFKRTASK